MTTILSQDQLQEILTNHIDRVVSSMDTETLVNTLTDYMRESFYDRGKVDEDMLINELFEHEYGESEPVKKFLMENGVDEDTIDDIFAL
jgi:uncharacterized protein (DUF2164 family)